VIAVVGGGITGLAIGWELERLGQDFVVLEAEPHAGGVIRSAKVEGRVLDWGPQRARLAGRVDHLVQDLGLESQLVMARSGLDLLVYRAGALHVVPFSARAFLRSDIISAAGKIRALCEPFTRGAEPDESVARYFARKLGEEFYAAVAGPLYGGLYASDPANMKVGLSLAHVLREFGVRRSLVLRFLSAGGRIQAPPACTFEEGMQALPDALARALGPRLKLGTAVRGLRRDGTGWRLELYGESIETDTVILTSPAPATARLLEPVAPAAAAAIATLRYNPLAVVHLDAETSLAGFGFQVAFTERELALRGVTFNDSLFGRRNLYTAYLGGAFHPEVATMSDGEVADRAVAEFRVCTGYSARPLAVRQERMPAWDVTWSGLDGVELPSGLHLAGNWWSRPGLPGRLAEAERVARRVGS
jgi:oxygen-dependent protoporphyrinogen oxidase